MSRRAIFGSVLLLSFVLAGCGAQGGTTQIKYEKGNEPTTIKAPQDGEYALYTASDLTPKVRQRLNKGDTIGFEKTSDGRVRAIAGTYNQVLAGSTQEAYWKLTKKD
ncbi:MAG TPA: hypothetical protein VGQ99_01095 [Tepidisphaeraceae bacterium]|jgi:hypothetical protein|nr:hypothetical protein [Tepidisphaeraceae bacterium]